MSETVTPAPTMADWWQTTSTPRSRSTQLSASRTSSRWTGLVGHRALAVGLRDERVDGDHLVAGLVEQVADRGADEAGRAGEQDLHGSS